MISHTRIADICEGFIPLVVAETLHAKRRCNVENLYTTITFPHHEKYRSRIFPAFGDYRVYDLTVERFHFLWMVNATTPRLFHGHRLL